jgi:small subunit ribosomal protein S18
LRSREPKQLKKKICKLCVDKIERIDYKDDRRLARFVTDRGKIVPRRISGACSRHQKQITLAVKRARVLALLPFTSDQLR